MKISRFLKKINANRSWGPGSSLRLHVTMPYSLRLGSPTPWPLESSRLPFRSYPKAIRNSPSSPSPTWGHWGQEVGTGVPSESYRGPTESNSTSRVEPGRPKTSPWSAPNTPQSLHIWKHGLYYGLYYGGSTVYYGLLRFGWVKTSEYKTFSREVFEITHI